MLLALNPLYAVSFMIHHGVIGFVTLGAVFLAVTGAEALYADLGHFGKRPIQTAWLFIVLPSLALNYMGQGALLIADPKAIENPFFLMFPDWALIPMVALATLATVIASQAVITGAYSLTRTAIQLGLMPRFEIRHTSESHSGQIYIPRINLLLFISVMLLVLLFRSSSALASAYGISVTGTMVVTAMMGFVVIWRVWKWSPVAAAALIAPFLFLDLTFLAANLLKVFEGGWVPLALGGVVMLLMYTWRRGSRLLFEKSRKLEFPLAELAAMLEKRPPQRVSGTAVFLTSDPESAPTALMHSLKHYKVLHEKNVILTIETAPTPRIDDSERIRMEQLSETFSKMTLRFGFMEQPNVPRTLATRPQARLAVRHHGDVVFPVPPRAQAGRAFGHAALAGPFVHRAEPQLQRRHRLFPDPDRARGRGGNAGDDLGAAIWYNVRGGSHVPPLDRTSHGCCHSPPGYARRRGRFCSRCGDRSILELAPPEMSVADAEAWARQLTLAGMEQKLRELEIWIAELEGVVAGWGGIRGDVLEALYTAPEYAGQGVGAALLDRLEGLMRGRGFEAVRAEASPNAMGFYLRRGYRVTGSQTPVGAWPIQGNFRPENTAARE